MGVRNILVTNRLHERKRTGPVLDKLPILPSGDDAARLYGDNSSPLRS